jgi:hypothetical protein
MNAESELYKETDKNEHIKTLRDYFMKTLDCTDEHGDYDLGKMINNAAINMGEAGIELCGLLLQEKLKLRTFEETFNQKRRAVYKDICENRMAWQPTQKGIEIMVDGDSELSDIRKEYENQKLYVEFLEQCQEQVRYFPRNVKDIVDAAKYGMETGILRPIKTKK